MQSRCCLHNIVGECIPLSRTAECGQKFPPDETLRRRDRKTNQYMWGREQNLTPDAETLDYCELKIGKSSRAQIITGSS
jgi:hypothetical protein